MADSNVKAVPSNGTPQPKSGSTLLIIVVAVVILAVIALGALYLLTPHGTAALSKPTFSVISSNKTETLSSFANNISQGFNTTQISVLYKGNVSINLYGISINAPLTFAVDRYYNDSRIGINVTNIPVLGNFSIVEIKNNTDYYSCFRGSSSSSTGESYNCTQETGQASIFQALNFSGNQTQATQFNSIVVHYGTVNSSSYNNMPCTNSDGYIYFSNFSANNTAAQGLTSGFGAGQTSSGNVTFLTCMSNQYKIPLTLQLYAIARNGSSATTFGLNMAEVQFGQSSSPTITKLPGPLVNST